MRSLRIYRGHFPIFSLSLDYLDACMDDSVATCWEDLAARFVLMAPDNKTLGV